MDLIGPVVDLDLDHASKHAQAGVVGATRTPDTVWWASTSELSDRLRKQPEEPVPEAFERVRL